MNKRCILLVEDDPDIREIVKDILETEGYSVAAASNGLEALEQLQKLESPCLILLDLMMPVMNGWEFLQRRRSMDSIASLPVVVVSAVAESQQPFGATKIVKKPPDIESLLKLVAQYCKCAANDARAA